jgi:prefoldin subunit 5
MIDSQNMSREQEIKQEAERIAFENATTDLRVHIMNLKAEAQEEREARIRAEKEVKRLEGAVKGENVIVEIGGYHYPVKELAVKLRDAEKNYKAAISECHGIQKNLKKAEDRAMKLEDIIARIQGVVIDFEDAAGLDPERHAISLIPNRIRALHEEWEERGNHIDRLARTAANLEGENNVLIQELAAARSREAETPADTAGTVANVTAEDFLIKENAALHEVGWDLAAAAMRVGRESDGVHRLMLATAKWVETIANLYVRTGRREYSVVPERHGENATQDESQIPTSNV